MAKLDNTKRRTASYISIARKTLKHVLQNDNTDRKWIEILSYWSQGKCHACQAPLEIASFKKTGSGAEWKFKCGHAHNVISLEECTEIGEGYGASSLRTITDGKQEVNVRIAGTRLSKENREIAIVKMLCHYTKPSLKKFFNGVQDSPIDVIAQDASKKTEYFQVTKLYDETFWRELGKDKNVNKIVADISSLTESAIGRKTRFDTTSKKEIILVIDTWPGVIKEIAQKAVGLPIITQAGFKEIWLAGSIPETTFRLFPL
jgi:hypothetical protein